MKRILLALCLFVSIGANAEDSEKTINGIRYRFWGNGEAMVVGCDDNLEYATIPSSVEGNKVTHIETKAFYGKQKLVSVSIPSSINWVGENVFTNCTALEAVTWDASAANIRKWAFERCTALKTFKMNNAVTAVEEGAFDGCKKLSSVQWSTNLESIGAMAFRGAALTGVVLPDKVNSVGEWAFQNNKDLAFVSISKGMTSIAKGAFHGCSSLRSVVIPASVNTIGDAAFEYCLNLRAVYYMGTNALNVQEKSFSSTPDGLAIYVKPNTVPAVQKTPFIGSKVKDVIPFTVEKACSTFTPAFDVDFTEALGLQAFVVSSYNYNADALTISPVKKAAAGTGLLLLGDVGTTYNLLMLASTPESKQNILKGTLAPIYLTNNVAAVKDQITVLKDGQCFDIETDKAIYNPAEYVHFTLVGDKNIESNTYVRYLNGHKVIETRALKEKNWEWQPPGKDFQGYFVEVFRQNSDGSETVLATTGVDVSSEWTKFPRYGFLSDYDENKTSKVIAKEVQKLNRLHINGVQFYDWMFEHQKPYIDRDEYTDLFNHQILRTVVKDYIKQIKGIGAKTMFYDLAYGTFLKGKTEHGIPAADSTWGWYDKYSKNKDGKYNDLYWVKYKLQYAKSDLGLMNPSNRDWIDHMKGEVKAVYKALDFDGYHVDQIGKWTQMQYNKDWKEIHIDSCLATYVKAMKDSFPSRYLVANAVSQYGSNTMLGTGVLNFAYNEVWDNDTGDGKGKEYTQFYDIIHKNKQYAGKDINTVFAAYLHHQDLEDYCELDADGKAKWYTIEKDGKKEQEMHQDENRKIKAFDTPSVLMTEAVIYALGGSHINMSGDHMIQGPYFLNNDWEMPAELDQAIVKYYDFLTAYENFLRDGGNEFDAYISGDNYKYHNWGAQTNEGPKCGTITTLAKWKDNSDTKQDIIQLLNFQNAKHTNWRYDRKEELRPKPDEIRELPFNMPMTKTVKRVWMASPDYMGGAPIDIAFTQDGNGLHLKVPYLKYWTMVVIDYADDAAEAQNTKLNYVYEDGNFVLANDILLPGGKAYIQIDNQNGQSRSSIGLSLQQGMNNGTSGGNEVNKESNDNAYYTLDGKRVKQPTRGVYIHRGKKIVVK